MAESRARAAGMLSRALAIAVLAALWAGAAGAAFAASNNDTLTQTLDGLQRRYRDTQSYSAKFVETIAPVGSPAKVRTGTVYFRKPGRMRWEFEEPSRELIVSDGTRIYNYDPDLNQVVEAPLAQALRAPGATEFLLGAGDISRDFKASLIKNSADEALTHVKLVPKSPGNTIELGIEDKTYKIQSIRVVDQLGNVTDLKLTGIEDNLPVSDSLFTFSPPPGADIVQSTPVK